MFTLSLRVRLSVMIPALRNYPNPNLTFLSEETNEKKHKKYVGKERVQREKGVRRVKA